MDKGFPLVTHNSFDDYIEKKELEKSKLNEKSEVINETFTECQKLLDRDILPELMNSKKFVEEIFPYINLYTSFNLYKLGWRMQFGKSKQWAGLCSVQAHEELLTSKSKNRNIYISIDFTKHDANWKQNFKDVMLHEMAHAVIFEIFYFSDQLKTIILLEKDPLHNASKGHGRFWDIVCGALTNQEGCPRFYKNANLEESFKNFKYICYNCENKKFGNNPKFATRCSICGKAIIVEKNDE